MNIDIENFAATNVDGDILNLNITNNIQSSSVFKLYKHSILHQK